MNKEIGLYRVNLKNYPLMHPYSIYHYDGNNVYEVWAEEFIGKYGSVYHLNCVRKCFSVKSNFHTDLCNFNPFRVSSDSYDIRKITQTPGEYHRRIFRPTLKKGDHGTNSFSSTSLNTSISNHYHKIEIFPTDFNVFISGIQQLSTLINKLKTICDNIYPNPNNFKTYGHEVRNVLILTCTEVEAQFKGILKANSYQYKSKTLTTKDYVKLRDTLKLQDYGISYSYYPDIPDLSPFKDWNSKNPTKSLQWYDSYNEVKHDNENNSHRACLIDTLNALAGLYILLLAQYGNSLPYFKDLVGNFFRIENSPSWDFEDWYIPPFEGHVWKTKRVELN
ncbi:MAG TPA: hypothetical protein PLC65_01480 [Bacteroidia bacterium]|nr:hypothetical protein [Bacteroidia bacterium]